MQVDSNRILNLTDKLSNLKFLPLKLILSLIIMHKYKRKRTIWDKKKLLYYSKINSKFLGNSSSSYKCHFCLNTLIGNSNNSENAFIVISMYTVL